jgi:hypothetical protein
MFTLVSTACCGPTAAETWQPPEAAVMTERERATWAALERVAARCSERDLFIVRELARLRVATARQLELLAFAELGGQHRDRTRRRVLARLVDWGLLTTLERRIGGVRAGSAGLVFVLDLLGKRLAQLMRSGNESNRARRPGTPTQRFLAHSLAVSELYVGLVERARRGGVDVARFDTEPACWWQDSSGMWVKPDASLTLSTPAVEDRWMVEVDLRTESLPTLRRKMLGYLNLAERGEAEADGLLPRVLVCVPDNARLAAVRDMVEQLPEPSKELLHVSIHEQAVVYLWEKLNE